MLDSINYRSTGSGGKPIKGYYTNHLGSLIIKRKFSTNNSSNHKYDINPWFVTGFSDAESTFIVPLRKRSEFKHGWEVLTEFKIGLHRKDLLLLESLKAYWGNIGTIKISKEIVIYRICSMKDLEVVINHFTRYPLITQKRADFELFKKVVEIKKSGRHTTLGGFQEIVNIRASLNKGLTESLHLAFPQTKPVLRPVVKEADQNIPDPFWVSGFASGEGNFLIGISKSLASKSGLHCYLRFKLSQDSRDEFLLRSFIAFFGCGSSVRNKNLVEYICVKKHNIYNIIMPFFKKYPILGVKALDFNDWCLGVEIVQSKAHLTPEGLARLQTLKKGMNTGRAI